LPSQESDGRICLSRAVCDDTLDNFYWLATDLTIAGQPAHTKLSRNQSQSWTVHKMRRTWAWAVFGSQPQHIYKNWPNTAGSTAKLSTILWRSRYNDDTSRKLVSLENPSGTITNSDLELAASMVQHDVSAHQFDVRKHTIASGSDNTPTVSWQGKGSTSTTGAPAYLMCLQSLHQRFHRYLSTSFFIPNKINAMADDCLRLWHLSDSELHRR
jgi:hypothetical protein